jgi:hypothetical protein
MVRRLPRQTLERPKMGFTVPLEALLAGARGVILAALAEPTPLDEILDGKRVRAYVSDYYAGRHRDALWVWTLFVLHYWYRMVAMSRARGSVLGAA